jgi:hypothetical protein
VANEQPSDRLEQAQPVAGEAAGLKLLAEAVAGLARRLEALREELTNQFSEVGKQMRFLSDQIAVNRERLAETRLDLGAEMVRLGELLGGARVGFRDELKKSNETLAERFGLLLARLRKEQAQLAPAAAAPAAPAAPEQKRLAAAPSLAGEPLPAADTPAAGEGPRRAGALAARAASRAAGGSGSAPAVGLAAGAPLPAVGQLKELLAASAEDLMQRLGAALKENGKVLAGLSRKLERFDDRMTVRTTDHEQRLRKLERRGGA